MVKISATIDYRDNPLMYEQVEDIPGEKAMFVKAAEIANAHATAKRNKPNRGIQVLDLCCGTALLWDYLELEDETLFDRVIGVDISKPYLDFARQKYYGRLAGQAFSPDSGAQLDFILNDAVIYRHSTQVEVVIGTSAYHHIEDERKPDFLRQVRGQLKDDGIVIFGENLIGDYKNLQDRTKVVTEFYIKRIEELIGMGITDKRIDILRRVLQYELEREYEWKHSYRMFRVNLDKAGFEVVEEHKVWPSKPFFLDGKVGDFVIVARKKRA